jgi:hypothetical protein
MENTTSYSIDTSSTTCHSQPKAPLESIGINKTNNSSNNVGQLDAKVPPKQPTMQDKFLQQSQQSQHQYQFHQQKDLITNYTAKFVNKPFTIETELLLIPRQHPAPHAPLGEHPKPSNNIKTKPESFQYDPFPTDFQYPLTTPKVQQRISPGMQKRWSRSSSNYMNQIQGKCQEKTFDFFLGKLFYVFFFNFILANSQNK